MKNFSVILIIFFAAACSPSSPQPIAGSHEIGFEKEGSTFSNESAGEATPEKPAEAPPPATEKKYTEAECKAFGADHFINKDTGNCVYPTTFTGEGGRIIHCRYGTTYNKEKDKCL